MLSLSPQSPYVIFLTIIIIIQFQRTIHRTFFAGHLPEGTLRRQGLFFPSFSLSLSLSLWNASSSRKLGLNMFGRPPTRSLRTVWCCMRGLLLLRFTTVCWFQLFDCLFWLIIVLLSHFFGERIAWTPQLTSTRTTSKSIQDINLRCIFGRFPSSRQFIKHPLFCRWYRWYRWYLFPLTSD